MARTRNIKPAFFDNDVLGSLTPLTRLLFIGLWCIADREGRLEDRPRRIKKTLLGYDDCSTEEVSGMLQQLHDNGFIIRYQASGDEYIQIVNFSKHQNPHMKEKPSEIEPPPGFEWHTGEHKESTIQAPDKYGADTEQEETDDPEDSPLDEQGEERKPPLQERRFNEFWAAYPRKIAKAKAKQAWMKLHPDEELYIRIIAAVTKQKKSQQWMKNNGEFIPHPTTWINGGRWDDEIEEVPQDGRNDANPGNPGVGNASAAYQGGASRPGALAGFKEA